MAGAADKEILCCFGVRTAAVAAATRPRRGNDAPPGIAQAVFAEEIGVPRLLDLFHVDAHPDARWVMLEEVAEDFILCPPRLGIGRPESVRINWEHSPIAS